MKSCYQYQTVYNDDNDSYNDLQPGLFSTVGMQNLSNSDGLEYTFDNFYGPGAATLVAGRAIKITTAFGFQGQPSLAYDPTYFAKSAAIGQIITDTLTISNNGAGSLEFSLNPFTDNRVVSENPAQGQNESQTVNQKPIGQTPTAGAKSGDGNQPIYPPMPLNQGGPDAFGNRWIDSDEIGGPTFNWIDISGAGTPVTLTDDSFAGPIELGMNFPFYGTNYSQVFIGSNGFISFGAGSNSYTNVEIPNATEPNNMIAACWDDMNPEAGGTIYYYHDTTNGRFIISYVGLPFYSGGADATFEIILNSNGQIAIEYGALNPGSRGLNQLTVGIENADGTDGLQVAYNAEYLHSNMAILFMPQATWLQTNIHGGTVPSGESALAIVTFDATGLAEGLYTGHLDLDSNDPANPAIDVRVSLAVRTGGPGCNYVMGDINGNGTFDGLDVVYAVNYYKGGSEPPITCDCPPHGTLFVGGDVNGSCSFNGLDITYIVNYFKGGPSFEPCASCPPGRASINNRGIAPSGQ